MLIAFVARIAAAGTMPSVPPPPGPQPFVVHEWGTFTSVAGADGAGVIWRPLLEPSDLPDFVYSADHPQPGLRDNEVVSKGKPSRVRMETPVIYFHGATEPTEVTVSVDFPEGHVTEWYPRARSVSEHAIDWGTFTVLPDDGRALVSDGSHSHYYPARNVRADLVRVCDSRGDQYERYLFYRGIGDFEPSLGARLEDGQLRLLPQGKAPVGLVFEKRGDRMGFRRIEGGLQPRPELDDDPASVRAALVDVLASGGLYRDEAIAMVETWTDHWFEDGLRVLYLLPRAETDRVLPLHVSPAPDQLVRVLVGRLEVILPEREAAVRSLLAASGDDAAVLASLVEAHGRFAEPVLVRLAPESPRARRLLDRLGRP